MHKKKLIENRAENVDIKIPYGNSTQEILNCLEHVLLIQILKFIMIC